jgi:condensin complex subunit 2
MIEKDPSNLIGDFDMASRVDPLFQKTAAAFDEGGVAGLLLNNLVVQ